MALRMLVDAGAAVARQHLRAEAHAEKRLVLPQRDRNPIDLTPDEIVGIVGALRPAEDHAARVTRHGRRQRIAEARPADVELQTAALQRKADTTRRGVFLMQDDQDWKAHGVRIDQVCRRSMNS
jgi:hypothetical protein